MFDVAVIGAGVVGGLVAREISKYQKSVCILEKMNDVSMGTTKANSAIVHAGFDAECGSLKAKLNVRGSEMMEELCRDLGVKYRRNGSLVVGFCDGDREVLQQLLLRGKKNGVRDLSIIERDEILKLEKNIGDDVVCALYAKTGAIVCPYELCMSAVGNAMDNGAQLKLNFEVRKIEELDSGYRISSSRESIECKTVINCAGVNADEVAELVGDGSFSITPRRGEYLLLDKESGSTVSHTVFRCPTKLGKGILVTPTVDGNLLLGPTAEDISDKGALETTKDGIDKIIKSANEQVKNINLRSVITSFCGLRARGNTGDFVINSPKKNFINVACIESPGLSSAPAIAEYVVELMAKNGEELLPRVEFSGKRRSMHYFRELSVEEKNELIRQRPEFAHIVCRCEKVSEGEILDAIRTNPKPQDIDGIKRRTRATMGRCQGGFCSPLVVELLAKELGVDPLSVTKSGGNSFINVCRTKEEF